MRTGAVTLNAAMLNAATASAANAAVVKDAVALADEGAAAAAVSASLLHRIIIKSS